MAAEEKREEGFGGEGSRAERNTKGYSKTREYKVSKFPLVDIISIYIHDKY